MYFKKKISKNFWRNSFYIKMGDFEGYLVILFQLLTKLYNNENAIAELNNNNIINDLKQQLKNLILFYGSVLNFSQKKKKIFLQMLFSLYNIMEIKKSKKILTEIFKEEKNFNFKLINVEKEIFEEYSKRKFDDNYYSKIYFKLAKNGIKVVDEIKFEDDSFRVFEENDYFIINSKLWIYYMKENNKISFLDLFFFNFLTILQNNEDVSNEILAEKTLEILIKISLNFLGYGIKKMIRIKNRTAKTKNSKEEIKNVEEKIHKNHFARPSIIKVEKESETFALDSMKSNDNKKRRESKAVKNIKNMILSITEFKNEVSFKQSHTFSFKFNTIIEDSLVEKKALDFLLKKTPEKIKMIFEDNKYIEDSFKEYKNFIIKFLNFQKVQEFNRKIIIVNFFKEKIVLEKIFEIYFHTLRNNNKKIKKFFEFFFYLSDLNKYENLKLNLNFFVDFIIKEIDFKKLKKHCDRNITFFTDFLNFYIIYLQENTQQKNIEFLYKINFFFIFENVLNIALSKLMSKNDKFFSNSNYFHILTTFVRFFNKILKNKLPDTKKIKKQLILDNFLKLIFRKICDFAFIVLFDKDTILKFKKSKNLLLFTEKLVKIIPSITHNYLKLELIKENSCYLTLVEKLIYISHSYEFNCFSILKAKIKFIIFKSIMDLIYQQNHYILNFFKSRILFKVLLLDLYNVSHLRQKLKEINKNNIFDTYLKVLKNIKLSYIIISFIIKKGDCEDFVKKSEFKMKQNIKDFNYLIHKINDNYLKNKYIENSNSLSIKSNEINDENDNFSCFKILLDYIIKKTNKKFKNKIIYKTFLNLSKKNLDENLLIKEFMTIVDSLLTKPSQNDLISLWKKFINILLLKKKMELFNFIKEDLKKIVKINFKLDGNNYNYYFIRHKKLLNLKYIPYLRYFNKTKNIWEIDKSKKYLNSNFFYILFSEIKKRNFQNKMLKEFKFLNIIKWVPLLYLVILHFLNMWLTQNKILDIVGLFINIILLIIFIVWIKKKEEKSTLVYFTRKLIFYNVTSFFISIGYILCIFLDYQIFKNLTLFFVIFFQLNKKYSQNFKTLFFIIILFSVLVFIYSFFFFIYLDKKNIFHFFIEVFYDFLINDKLYLIISNSYLENNYIFMISNFFLFSIKKLISIVYLASLIIYLKNHRKKKSLILKDLNSICILCGTSKDSLNWKHHINEVHNIKKIFDYLFTLLIISEKNHNHIDKIFVQKIKNKDPNILKYFIQ